MTGTPGRSGNGEQERALAARLFNETWALLDQPNRSPSDDLRMIHIAHASRFHWEDVGTDQNRAIGEWQVSRVYAALDRAEPALFHAFRALGFAQRQGVDRATLASCFEGLARAHAVAGDAAAAGQARERASEIAAGIIDAEDRAIVLADIASLPPA